MKSNTMEKTLAIIKPDAVKAGNIGKIIQRIEEKGFKIVGIKMLQLTMDKAKAFYLVHKDKPFFNGLVEFISSGPVVVLALVKDNAIKEWRDLMGATNPTNAEPNTLRKLYGASIDNNAVHGSDSVENGKIEVAFFFPELQ